MRIIAGLYKGKKLLVPDLKKKKPEFKPNAQVVRPTTDFLRENLFNILQTNIENSTFADIFAGSGAVGIEALSRGAKSVTFVEINNSITEIIKKNLDSLLLIQKVILHDGIKFLKSSTETFDIIFADPPYFMNYEEEILQAVLNGNTLNINGILIIQHHKKVKLSLEPYDYRLYGINALSFYRK